MIGFHFSSEVEAAFGDVDAMGHVNNVVYLKWLETARIEYWIRVTGQAPPASPPLTGRASRESGLGVVSGALIDIILARTEIDYRSPVAYGETLDVFVRTSLIKWSSLVLDYAVVSQTDGRLVAEAKTVVVCYDYSLRAKKTVPEATRKGILTLDPEARVQI